MAIINADRWQSLTGNSVSGADLAAVGGIAEAVSEALTRRCYPYILEPKTITLFAFDAPPTPELWIPKPVRSVSAVYYHCGASGDSSLVDLTADLLVAGTDYINRVDDVLTGWNRSGCLRRANSSAWGVSYRRPVGRLAYAIEAERGSVFVSALLGPTSVSGAVQLAASTAVSMLYQRRKTGVPVGSESWNGYSASGANTFTAEGALETPEVRSLLMAAGVLPIHVGR